MRRRILERLFVALALSGASLMAFAAGCSDENALVGGQCAAGYTQCGQRCVKGSTCDALIDATADVSQTPPPSDASDVSDLSSDATPSGDAPPDGAGGGDTVVDAVSEVFPTGDGGAGEATFSDASTDAPLSEATSDADSGDAAGVDAGTSDATPDATSDATSADAAATDASSDALVCLLPLLSCGGQCIDVAGDPLNCGGCNVVCASQLCTGARCVGAASGGIVYIGHDYMTTLAGTAQARVLSNSIFIPQANPLHVMSYERYADPRAVADVTAILRGVALQSGRTLNIQSTSADTDVPTKLALPTYDVLLVYDQQGAADGALATLGASWSSTLATFTLGGGVVVVLDGSGGLGQMPAFATATGLLDVSAHSPILVGTPLIVASRSDVVGTGVLSPYGAGQSSVSIATEPNGGNVVYVVDLTSDAAAAAAVVVHKSF